MPSSVEVPIVNGHIAIEFSTIVTYETENDSYRLAKVIENEIGEDNAVLAGLYADLVTYTQSIVSNLPNEAPKTYKALQTWWNDLGEKSPGMSYMEFYQGVDAKYIVQEYRKALRKAHAPWKPDGHVIPAEDASPE